MVTASAPRLEETRAGLRPAGLGRPPSIVIARRPSPKPQLCEEAIQAVAVPLLSSPRRAAPLGAQILGLRTSPAQTAARPAVVPCLCGWFPAPRASPGEGKWLSFEWTRRPGAAATGTGAGTEAAQVAGPRAPAQGCSARLGRARLCPWCPQSLVQQGPPGLLPPPALALTAEPGALTAVTPRKPFRSPARPAAFPGFVFCT